MTRLLGDDLLHLLKLVEQADSIELKLTLPDDRVSARRARRSASTRSTRRSARSSSSTPPT